MRILIQSGIFSLQGFLAVLFFSLGLFLALRPYPGRDIKRIFVAGASFVFASICGGHYIIHVVSLMK